jgi:transcription termination/antitermination protein NusG
VLGRALARNSARRSPQPHHEVSPFLAIGIHRSEEFPGKLGCTKGGEALPQIADAYRSSVNASISAASGPWYALWTHSHCEQLVQDQLQQKGLPAFLPRVDVWSRRRGVQRLIKAPMFPGYLFLQHPMDKETYLAVSRARGLVRVLGERWDRLAEIPHLEMAAIQQIDAACCRVLPFPYLKEGQRVRIVRGPLAGVEGLLVESRAHKGLLVLSVHLLQRSVAMSVDATTVVPA